MKKLIVQVLFIVGTISFSFGQDISKNALGLRLGDNDGFGGEISYQRGLSDNNRLEFDLGFRNNTNYDAFKLVGLHQWVWNIDGGFNWYAGVGAGVGSWSTKDRYYRANGNDLYVKGDSGAYFLAAGDLGIEYLFDFPLQVAIDFRPEFYFNSDDYRTDNFGPDLALSLRYRF